MTNEASTNEATTDLIRDATACGTSGASCLGADDAERLATALGAVADPVRLQVLSMIANAPAGEVCACDFVGPIGRSQPTISHHLKVLSEAGLVEGHRQGRWIWYRLSPGRLDGLVASLTSAAATPG